MQPTQLASPVIGNTLDPTSSFDAAIDAVVDRLREEAGRLVAEIQALQRKSTDNDHEIGRKLGRLSEDNLAKHFGQPSFKALCETQFGFKLTKANKLIRLAAELTAQQCAELGATKADVLLDLTRTLAKEARESLLAGATIPLWDGGPTVALATSSANELRALAKRLRAHEAERKALQAVPTALPAKRQRGRTVTRVERTHAAESGHRLQEAGITGTVRASATRPGKPARFAIEGLDLASLDRLVAGVAPVTPAAPPQAAKAG